MDNKTYHNKGEKRMKHPIMTIHMASSQDIQIELYPEKAPNSVNGLIWMIERNGFDQMAIQRIVPDFVLQPWYDENIMPVDYQYLIDGEFEANGYLDNDLKMTKYAVGLAGDGAHISSPGCFFIVVGDQCQERLNGKFAGIGYVISGFDEIERIMHVPLRKIESGLENVLINQPVKDEVILHIDLDLNGYQPQEPDQYLPEDLNK